MRSSTTPRVEGTSPQVGPGLLALLALLLGMVDVSPADAFELRRTAFSGGTVESTGGAFLLRGTVGEVGVAGRGTGGSYRLGEGFWPGFFRLLATDAPAQGGGPQIRGENGLAQSFPNPFRNAATVSFSLAQSTPVRLTVFDVTGRRVATLVDGVRAAGRHEIRWNGNDDSGLAVASGVFFYRLDAASYSATKRMLRLR